MGTKIEWATDVWNPVTGCTKISPGCQNCYAERMAKRLRGRYGYPVDNPFRVTLHPERMFQPYKWKKPSRVFVCSMSDLFHRNIPFDDIWSIYDTMSGAASIKGHTFIVLTKRPERALEFYKWVKQGLEDNLKLGKMVISWPIRNLWLGVTCENQEQADKRIPILLQIPAAVRFLSVEPMLGPVDLRLNERWCTYGDGEHHADCETKADHLNGIIVGGESGHHARPMHPDWARKVRDDCVEAGVPFFFKQWGEWLPIISIYPNADNVTFDTQGKDDLYGEKGLQQKILDINGNFREHNPFRKELPQREEQAKKQIWMGKVGKKAAGRELDGKIWNQLPGA